MLPFTEMKRPPTDLEILRRLYDNYYQVYAAYSRANKERETKIYVPVDIAAIASDFEIDDDIIFGRLYYYLNRKHGYKQDDGSSVHLFTLQAGNDRHCVHFPLLASVLAELTWEKRKFHVATTLSIISLCIAVISIVLSLLKR
jgi:hypothetical protein